MQSVGLPLELLVKAEPPVQMEADDMRVPLTLMTLGVAGRSAGELIIPSFVSTRAYGPVVCSLFRSGLCGPPACRGAARPAGSAAAARQGSGASAALQRVSPAHRKAGHQFGQMLLLVLVSCALRSLFFGNVKSVAHTKSLPSFALFSFSICQCLQTLGHEKRILFDKICAWDTVLETICLTT